MRKFLLMAAALVMAVCSCSQDEVLENVVSAPEGSFKAVIEKTPTTRTYIGDDLSVLWKAGDKVLINDVSYTAATGGSSSTILSPTQAGVEAVWDGDGEYTAYYPASIASDPGIPAIQKYVDGTNASLPMKAVSGSKDHLSFKNLGAVLAVTVTPTEDLTKVKSIRVSSNKAMSGALSFITYKLMYDSDASRTVTLSMENAVTLSGATTFHIALPAGTYQDLDITVSDGYNGYSMVTNSGTDIVLEKNYLYPVTFSAQSRTSDYLTLTALEDDSKVGFNNKSVLDSYDLYFSTNEGANWYQVTSNFEDITLSKGESVWFLGENETLCKNRTFVNFAMSGSIKASGNIMSLLDGDNPGTEITEIEAFSQLFYNCSALKDAKDLHLPATTLTESCYNGLFSGCYNLKTAPELPAQELAEGCYSYMFQFTAITTAPELPATTLAENCYSYMFSGCTALKSAPELPATTLAEDCYCGMFAYCTNLFTAPELPSMTLANYCYCDMFYGCGNLMTAPKLPATTLTSACYASMFRGCENLKTAPELPATTLDESCYDRMFQDCSALESAPKLPATTLAEYCYYHMFDNCYALKKAPALWAETLIEGCYWEMYSGCSNLASAAMLATDVTASNCLLGFLKDAGGNATNPTLYVAPAMTENETIIAQKGNFTIQAAD